MFRRISSAGAVNKNNWPASPRAAAYCVPGPPDYFMPAVSEIDPRQRRFSRWYHLPDGVNCWAVRINSLRPLLFLPLSLSFNNTDDRRLVATAAASAGSMFEARLYRALRRAPT